MIARYFRFYYLIVFGMFLNTVFLFSQEEIVTNEDFIFSWQKANGDQYEIPVKNNLDVKKTLSFPILFDAYVVA